MESKFDIARQFRDGMLCAIAVASVTENPSAHWVAGWKAGKEASHSAINNYLRSIGVEEMAIISLCRPEGSER